MRIRGDVLSFASWRRLAAQLLVALLCLRALVPAGFMTDAHAAKNGVFRIVICTANALNKTVDLDLGTGDLGSGGETQKTSPAHDQPCAFAGLAVDFSDAVQQYAIVKPHIATSVRIEVTRSAMMPPARAGPVLGSRAPPTLS